MSAPIDLQGHLQNRIAAGKKSLIIYYPAGYPDMDGSQAALKALAQAGADVLEIGFPYSDPMMDGGIIQQVGQYALQQGYNTYDDLQMAGRLTKEISIPTVLMTYYNIAWHYQQSDNLNGFAKDVQAAGLAGAILPDLPASEGSEWNTEAANHEIQTVYLVSPTSDEERIARVGEVTTGFIYATSHMGVTGLQSSLSNDAAPLVERIRRVSNAPICMGIGISTPDQAAQVAEFADGVIVGSAVIKAVVEGGIDKGVDLVQRLKAAIS